MIPSLSPSEVAEAIAHSGVSNDQDRERVVEHLMAYRPYGVLPIEWERVRRFVLLIVADSGPPDLNWAKTTVSYVAGYVLWANSKMGAPLRRDDLFYPHLISQYTHAHYAPTGRAAANAARRLTIVAAALGYETPAAQFSARRHETMPYSRDELTSAHAWARTRSTPYGREQAAITIALAAGAGLRGSELMRLERIHLTEVSGRLEVALPGKQARTLPVRADWVPLLRDGLRTIDTEGPLLKRHRSEAARSPATAGLGPHAPLLARLRASWIVELASRIPTPELIHYAGFGSVHSLRPYERFFSAARADADTQILLASGPPERAA
jgi:integrase